MRWGGCSKNAKIKVSLELVRCWARGLKFYFSGSK